MNYTKYQWGYELIWANTAHYFARTLIVLDNERMPYIYHKHRHKTLHVMQGTVQLKVEGTSRIFNTGDSFNVYPRVMHQILALKGDATLLECGTALQDDVVVIS